MMKAAESRYYDAAFEKALSRLRAGDQEELRTASGARIRDGGLCIRYFGKDYAVSEDGGFEPDDLPMMEKILVLHYLAAGRSESSGEFVSYENLPNGMFYSAAFRRFGPAILLKTFAAAPRAMAAAAEPMGGTAEEYGDCSVRIRVFPRVEIIAIVHAGDDEFPPEAGMLFRAGITRLLSLEDVSRLGGITALRLGENHRNRVTRECSV